MSRRSKLGKAFRVTERISNPVQNLVGMGRPVTDAAKSRLYEVGIEGDATILKAPVKQRVSEVQENVGRFTARIELPGEEPYEANVWQAFWSPEWEQLRPDARVKCRVDPDNREKILLIVPEPTEPPKRRASGGSLNLRRFLGDEVKDSSDLIANGRRAKATVLSSEPIGKKAPGTDDEFFLLNLELSAEDEARPWQVEYGQRVPKGAEAMVKKGETLEAAFGGVDDSDRVAIDWPASSGGRFS